MTRITSNLTRGERGVFAAPSDGVGVAMTVPRVGVTVGVLVSVDAGNTNVMAGKGTRVVVAEGKGVTDGVGVSVGVPGALVGLGVPVAAC